jgi:putative transposase
MPRAEIVSKQAAYTLELLHAPATAGKLLANKREAIRLGTAMMQVEAAVKMLHPASTSPALRREQHSTPSRLRAVRALFPWLSLVVADDAYAGHFEAALHLAVQIVRRPNLLKGFVLLPKRWRVEQAFRAGRFCPCLLVDHETLPHISEAMIRLGSIMRSFHTLTA